MSYGLPRHRLVDGTALMPNSELAALGALHPGAGERERGATAGAPKDLKGHMSTA